MTGDTRAADVVPLPSTAPGVDERAMRKSIAPIVVTLIAAALPSTAFGGVLLASVGGYGEEQVSYEARNEPSSVIVARTLADGQLLLTDSKAKITLASRENPLSCHLRGDHTAICRRPTSFPIASVRIRGARPLRGCHQRRWQ